MLRPARSAAIVDRWQFDKSVGASRRISPRSSTRFWRRGSAVGKRGPENWAAAVVAFDAGGARWARPQSLVVADDDDADGDGDVEEDRCWTTRRLLAVSERSSTRRRNDWRPIPAASPSG